MGKGENRDWGYASSDEDENLAYTSYEKNGSVNRYKDNGDGGHGHGHWENQEDYNAGKKPDQLRIKSNKNRNPSTGEVQANGGCYLTSACMRHFQNTFDDECYELQVLRHFRDVFVSKEDIDHYYQIAPKVVASIDNRSDYDNIYKNIYENVILFCVNAIENENYDLAYDRYRTSILSLEETYLKPALL